MVILVKATYLWTLWNFNSSHEAIYVNSNILYYSIDYYLLELQASYSYSQL